MPVFQVLSRSVQAGPPPRKKPQRFRQEWLTSIRFILAIAGAGGFFTLLAQFRGPYDIVFILLPVFLYIATTQFQRYRLHLPMFIFNVLSSSTPAYLLLTFCFALIYYSVITGIELLIHPNPNVSRVILITTALAWAIILDPVRAYVQKGIERRFNQRNREAARAIEAFTTTLYEEINLDQLRERFLTVIQQTMQPYSVALWTRITNAQQERSDSAAEISIPDDDPLLAYVLRHPSPLEVERLQLDSPALADLKLQAAEIILPLTNQGELLGLLILGPRLKVDAYTVDERNMLNTLAPQVAPALRVAQLVREQQAQVRERERIDQELRTAQAIQRTFLPREVPALPGWHLAPYYQPAREVGGDFYDVLPLDDGRLSLVIGDVTGKGVPAALLMATVHTMLRSTVREIRSPGAILARVNDLLAAEIPTGMFITCFFALLDPASGQLHYANAGHELPYCQAQGKVTELRATGMPLGLMPDMCYDEHTFTIEPGERLLFYSDGLVEAHNTSREMLGFPRLRKLLAEHAEQPSLIESVLGELRSFTGEGWEQEDDVTMLTLQRMAEVPQAQSV